MENCLRTNLGLTKSDCKIGNILSFDTGSDSIPKTVTLTVSFEIRKVRQMDENLLGVFVVLKGRSPSGSLSSWKRRQDYGFMRPKDPFGGCTVPE